MNNHETDAAADSIFDGLESTSLSPNDARELLAELGHDVEKDVAAFKQRLSLKIRSHTWKSDADRIITHWNDGSVPF